MSLTGSGPCPLSPLETGKTVKFIYNLLFAVVAPAEVAAITEMLVDDHQVQENRKRKHEAEADLQNQKRR